MTRRDAQTARIDQFVSGQISSLRISKGMTRKELAEDINVTQQQLLKYEHGIDRISAGRLMLIAKALSKDVSYFFEGFDCLDEENINKVGIRRPDKINKKIAV
jgi:transcriptional regulator with XRE-family HTH domain